MRAAPVRQAQNAIIATKFDFNTSILILVFVVLGGMGNMLGSILAAALLTVLPELLRSLNDYRMLIYAIVLILMMLFNSAPAMIQWREQMTEKLRKTFGKRKRRRAKPWHCPKFQTWALRSAACRRSLSWT